MYLFLYVMVFVCMQDTELLILTEERQGKVIFRRPILKIYPLSLSHIVFCNNIIYPTKIWLFKVTKETLEKGVKYVQS